MAASGPLVVLSVDGMPPAFYLQPEKFGLKVPTLRRLVNEGTYAEAVESVYPSVTYPAHASIVTGVLPRRHGIYSHLASPDITQDPRPWRWDAAGIRVPTLWDRAHAAGLSTAALSWPVTVGSAIAWHIPEVWNPKSSDPYSDLSVVARLSTPGLLPELLEVLGGNKIHPAANRARGDAVIHLLHRYRPNLLLAHFVEFDHAAHRYGPFAPEALATIETMDTEIARIRDALAALPDGEEGTLVVLSDHGSLPVSKEAAPNVALAEAGLFGRNTDGTLQLKRLGTIQAGGCAAVYWLDTPSATDRRALEQAVTRLKDAGAVGDVIDRARLAALGADPEAEFVLEAAPDFSLSNRTRGELVLDPGPDRGSHGHLPGTPGMEGSFLMQTPGRHRQANPSSRKLGRVPMTSLYPLFLQALGLEENADATDL